MPTVFVASAAPLLINDWFLVVLFHESQYKDDIIGEDNLKPRVLPSSCIEFRFMMVMVEN